jgi:hypothetical protein
MQVKTAHETTLFGIARGIIPVLQRLAKWQGYDDLSKELSSKREVEIVYKDLNQASNKATAIRPVDFAATSRRVAKRFTPDERGSMLETIWSGKNSGNPKIVMRTIVEQLLPSADGRRGEDLREVSKYINSQFSNNKLSYQY